MNPYEVLGVSSEATQDEISASYRKLARKYHPDAPGGGDAEKFKELALAYEVLSDPEKRERYDKTGQFSTENSQVFATVAELVKQEFRPSASDPIRAILARVDRQRAMHQNSITDCRVRLSAMVAMTEEFKRQNAETANVASRDFICTILESQVAALQQEIESIKAQVELGTKVLEFFNGLKSGQDRIYGASSWPQSPSRLASTITS